jgi:hypothetical protein
MVQQKPVKRPVSVKGCESCIFRYGDFFNDTVYPTIIRCYCKARHFNVDAEAMSKDCDFWKLSSDYERPKEDTNRYGL